MAQRCSSVVPGTPLFSSLLNYRHNNGQSSGASFTDGFKPINAEERTNYPFTISVEDGGNTLGLTAQIVKQFDPTRICEYMQTALESLTDALDHSPEMKIRELGVLPISERELLVRSWNTTEKAYPIQFCIHQLFEAQVEQSPHATAVIFEDQKISYYDLNSRANSLAHQLIDLGVKPDSLVAICVDRSIAMIIGLLAVLKAGGAYVPLDPNFASERLRNNLSDASPSIILADDFGTAALGSSILNSMVVIDPNVVSNMPTVNPHIHDLGPAHLAYVIYTSGSTGKPKGVMIEHKGIVNQMYARPEIAQVSSTSRVLQFSSFTFDASVDEIFCALCFGGCLHVITDNTRLDPVRLWSYMEDHSITLAELTPSVLQDCRDFKPLSTPLTLMFGGEALPPRMLTMLSELIPNGSVLNSYGPTETTVDALVWNCHGDFNGDITPIGRPTANRRIYVLDPYRNLVPAGVAG
ncbi:hypothetical protein BGX27_004841, partial [Mortierella sp. AM989]